ncbi:hypothetical protein ACFWJT_14145 [Streptomyces sp. NPDC127069]|uniref:hypothetical protein n=1 Tax=Streptomyces sp. NPDC127069 TaxID=3347128 RepID=UPI00365DFE8A
MKYPRAMRVDPRAVRDRAVNSATAALHWRDENRRASAAGSTSRPKAVTRDIGGCLAGGCWAVENVFGVRAGDVFWTDSHPGWVMGRSFTVYGPRRRRDVPYEGSPADTPPRRRSRGSSPSRASACWTGRSPHRAR